MAISWVSRWMCRRRRDLVYQAGLNLIGRVRLSHCAGQAGSVFSPLPHFGIPLARGGIFRYHCSAFRCAFVAVPATPGPSGTQGFFVQGWGFTLSEQYFTSRPSAEHAETSFTATLRGMEFTFVTDAGVFSRDRVDFGSLLLIETMRVNSTDTVLDVGCGYGPIGATAARLATEGRVYMVDVNERAAGLARRNLKANKITNAEVRMGDALEPVRGIVFDTILTNPPIRAGKVVIYRMVDEAHAALKPGGSLWVVIQNKQGAPSMKKKLHERFGNVVDVERKGGFHIFQSIK